MTKPYRLTKRQHESLKPFADREAESQTELEAMDRNELKRLQQACEATSRTNCWWAEYHAAQRLRARVGDELGVREREAAATERETTEANSGGREADHGKEVGDGC